MPEILDRLGAALLDATLAATAISGFVVLAIVQSRQPARRRGWARVGLLSTLALLPLAALNPFPRIDLRGPIRAILPDGDRPPGRAFGHGRPDPPPGPACEGPASGKRKAARGVVVAYLSGLSGALGLLALGAWGTSRLVGRGSAASAGSMATYRGLGVPPWRARPRLLVSGRVARPVLVGAIRPALLIPPAMDRPEAAEGLRLGLLHELAHAEAHDPAYMLGANLAQAVWFFLPPVWWIRDQMKLDQEFLADRRASDQFGTSGRYASSLVGLATGSASGDGPGSRLGGVSARPGVASSLFQRVLMLLKCPFAVEARTPVWWRAFAGLTLVMATLGSSGLTLRGLRGWSESGPGPIAEEPRSFRMADLVIGQGAVDEQPFDLRFRLPDRFLLTMEILADPADLAGIEVMGHRLGPPLRLRPADQRPPDLASGRPRARRRLRVDRGRRPGGGRGIPDAQGDDLALDPTEARPVDPNPGSQRQLVTSPRRAQIRDFVDATKSRRPPSRCPMVRIGGGSKIGEGGGPRRVGGAKPGEIRGETTIIDPFDDR